MAEYRTPTEKEREKLERARQMMQEGIMGKKDPLGKIMPSYEASADRDMRQAKKLRESVSEAAREGEAYEQAGYKKGGKVSKYAKGGYVRAADGIAQRGKTRGKVC